MAKAFLQTLFTDAVKAAQTQAGSRRAYARIDAAGDLGPDRLGPQEQGFIQARDSLYLASIGSGGWPYVQHRGGRPGFIRILDEQTLLMPDYRGNRQYITLGNLAGSNRVALFFMDYLNQTRLKLLGQVQVVTPEHPDWAVLLDQVPPPVEGGGEPAPLIERLLKIQVVGYDWNCPQHIPRLVPADLVLAAIAERDQTIAQLQAELARLKQG